VTLLIPEDPIRLQIVIKALRSSENLFRLKFLPECALGSGSVYGCDLFLSQHSAVTREVSCAAQEISPNPLQAYC
jgi:hypothetical protein